MLRLGSVEHWDLLHRTLWLVPSDVATSVVPSNIIITSIVVALFRQTLIETAPSDIVTFFGSGHYASLCFIGHCKFFQSDIVTTVQLTDSFLTWFVSALLMG